MSSYIFSTDNLVVNQIVLEREREYYYLPTLPNNLLTQARHTKYSLIVQYLHPYFFYLTETSVIPMRPSCLSQQPGKKLAALCLYPFAFSYSRWKTIIQRNLTWWRARREVVLFIIETSKETGYPLNYANRRKAGRTSLQTNFLPAPVSFYPLQKNNKIDNMRRNLLHTKTTLRIFLLFLLSGFCLNVLPQNYNEQELGQLKEFLLQPCNRQIASNIDNGFFYNFHTMSQNKDLSAEDLEKTETLTSILQGVSFKDG
ncbi:MAG: hypothetical protein LUG18_09890 [Candidatus Azobacteroides sp.]|nr:hypothetical protein [Candidatus Azobacteroides sp.]